MYRTGAHGSEFRQTKKIKGERIMGINDWFWTPGRNSGSSYTDFTQISNEADSSYTDFTLTENIRTAGEPQTRTAGSNGKKNSLAGKAYICTVAMLAVFAGAIAGACFYLATGNEETVIRAAAESSETAGTSNTEGTDEQAVILVKKTNKTVSEKASAKVYTTNTVEQDLPEETETYVSPETEVEQEYTEETETEAYPEEIGDLLIDDSGFYDTDDRFTYSMSDPAYQVAEKIMSSLWRDSDVETARAIFNWVHSNVYYTIVTSDLSFEEAAYRGFTRKNGDCFVSFACAKMLLDCAGIPNMPIERYPIVKNGHFWNLVLLDGEWYHCDATVFKDHQALYFMLTDEELADSHHSFDSSLYPERAHNG